MPIDCRMDCVAQSRGSRPVNLQYAPHPEKISGREERSSSRSLGLKSAGRGRTTVKHRFVTSNDKRVTAGCHIERKKPGGHCSMTNSNFYVIKLRADLHAHLCRLLSDAIELAQSQCHDTAAPQYAESWHHACVYAEILAEVDHHAHEDQSAFLAQTGGEVLPSDREDMPVQVEPCFSSQTTDGRRRPR